MRLTVAAFVALAGLGLSGCASLAPLDTAERANFAPVQQPKLPLHPNETPELRQLINEYADLYGVPRPLVHRVIIRESTHRPGARNGPYYGLMQILPATARTMGFRGAPGDLLDAETNLKYAVKYLRGAWLVSDGSYDRAVGWYARGYYYEAKRRGMLVETGLRAG
ncbi:transglycosylase [Roseivivax marinus]|jgi:soluble lytic murein transglycosylase-like protein|uniref:Transglycosylase n=1 Tax=Roseivivax marinus TaxID=1379903 RepID=W4HK81_9RHOB|nr:lytic transglycosylase domain-containing protein [Roseivivax marinus]ETW12375.1 transglycosylase [Roseivivax marinus]SEK23693.1 Transglycosylase SLT domain-containing protein [Roseivivax marinus]